MADFFYRQADQTLFDNIGTGGRIRNNAYVKIIGKGFSLPAATSGMTSTYNPNSTGRPAPVLKDVKVALKGTAGSLRSAEVAFTCFDLPSFESAEQALLLPGSEVTVQYGYAGPATPSGAGSHDFKVYDYSFKITKEGYFDCSFKAVGKGGTYSEEPLNVLAHVPAHEFITNYNGFNEKFKVANIFNFIDWAVQNKTGMANSKAFDPPQGISGPFNGYGDHASYGVLIAPDSYNPPDPLGTGALTWARVQYTSLGFIVGAINKWILAYMTDETGATVPHTMKFDAQVSDVQLQFPAGKMWCPDPVSMLFPYPKNTAENAYHKTEKLAPNGNFFAIDEFDGLGAMAMTGKKDTPAKILIGRDLLISIQKAFADETKEKAVKDEPKPDGKMPLERFMKKIFAKILENTGGAWDLYLDQRDGEPNTIYIVNRKSPGDGSNVTALVLDAITGKNGIRDLSISAKVPKDIAAKVFGGAPETAAVVNTITEKETPEPEPETMPPAEQQLNARAALTEGEYDNASITAAKSAIQALVKSQTPKEVADIAALTSDSADYSQTPFPLVFSATIDGIEGFKFGDTLACSYLPARYNKPEGPKCVFTVTEFTHTISNNDWTTQITALARLR
tara:strand:- start:183 stop:2042 length:1860 start_codon:yes stop_codon:yes gene_type:complete